MTHTCIFYIQTVLKIEFYVTTFTIKSKPFA